MKRIGLVVGLMVLLGCDSGGLNALDRMNPEQREFARNVLTEFTPYSTEEDIMFVLGDPYRGSGTDRPAWYRPGGGQYETVIANFAGGNLVKLRYLSAINPTFSWDLVMIDLELVPDVE